MKMDMDPSLVASLAYSMAKRRLESRNESHHRILSEDMQSFLDSAPEKDRPWIKRIYASADPYRMDRHE